MVCRLAVTEAKCTNCGLYMFLCGFEDHSLGKAGKLSFGSVRIVSRDCAPARAMLSTRFVCWSFTPLTLVLLFVSQGPNRVFVSTRSDCLARSKNMHFWQVLAFSTHSHWSVGPVGPKDAGSPKASYTDAATNF